MRAIFYKGIRLVQHFQDWNPFAARGADAEHQGVTQAFVKLVPDSPNFKRGDLRVRCVLGPIEDADIPDGLDAETTVEIALLDTEALLIANAKTLGSLARTIDEDLRADVAAAQVAGLGQSVTLAAIGGGWVPTIGRLMLLRNPATGAGFVTQIITTPDGTHVTADLDVDITDAWEAIDVAVALDGVRYHALSAAAASDTKNQRWRPDVTYLFEAGEGSGVRRAAAHAVAL